MKRIDVLPDEVLLEVFDFYVERNPPYLNKAGVEAWQSLVHVCRRWRTLVLGSPRRLNLQLCCRPETPRDRLNIWPALPLLVEGVVCSTSDAGTNNIIATLGQSDRVRRVFLMDIAGCQLEQVLAAMEVPFPELTDLQLWSCVETPVIPDSFLGGSSPRLRIFTLYGILFPGLPNLLLSATHLVELNLHGIPHSWYISPESIVASLSALSSLRILFLKFRSPQSRSDWESRSPPPLEHSILPALYKFHFKGITEYLEDLVSRIETPQLDEMDIIFFHQIDFDCPQLARFINRSPILGARDEAHVQFDDDFASVELLPQSRAIGIGISCGEPDRQLPSIAQICNSSFPTLSTIEDLYIKGQHNFPLQAIENSLWLQLLLPFTAVKNLYLSKELEPGIAAALQGLVGARITEVLPSLQKIFVEQLAEPLGSFRKNIRHFAAARQFSEHPIAISLWDIGMKPK